MNTNNELRHGLIDFIDRPYTHASLKEVLENFPEKLINEKPSGVPYTFWQLVEHIRISQFDMIDFMTNSNYKEMEWPKDYWPDASLKATVNMWNEAIAQFYRDLDKMKKIIEDPAIDLLTPIPHGTGQTILREVLQVIDHNGYHLGQLVVMMRAVGAWNK
jgi:uncharacterized damage-inducible protein DinB